MMKKILLAAMAAAALSACSDDNLQDSNAALQVNTSIQSDARAVVTGTNFSAAGESIGVFLTAANGGAYEGLPAGYSNVKYTSAGPSSGLIWETTTPVYLSPAEGKAIAYYPHAEGVTDIRAVPVTVSGTAQTDYMYSGWVTGVSTFSPKANFTMRHALARVDVTLTKGDYNVGPATVTSISVESPAIGTGATMDITDGRLASVTGQGTPVARALNLSLGIVPAPTSILVVPDASRGAQAITVKLTIDGKGYSVPVTLAGAMQQGKIYNVSLTLNDSKLQTTSVTIEQWNTVAKPEGQLQPEKARP